MERSRFTQRSVPRMFAESTFRYGRRVNIRGSGMAKLESIFVPSPSSQCRPPATPALTRPKAPSPAHPTAPSSSSTLSSSSPPSRPCLLPASLLTPLSYVIPPSLRPSSVLPPPSSLRPPPYALLRPPCSLLALLLHGATSPTPSILRAAPGRRGSVRITSRSVGRSADRVWLEHSVSRKGSKLSATRLLGRYYGPLYVRFDMYAILGWKCKIQPITALLLIRPRNAWLARSSRYL